MIEALLLVELMPGPYNPALARLLWWRLLAGGPGCHEEVLPVKHVGDFAVLCQLDGMNLSLIPADGRGVASASRWTSTTLGA